MGEIKVGCYKVERNEEGQVWIHTTVNETNKWNRLIEEHGLLGTQFEVILREVVG